MYNYFRQGWVVSRLGGTLSDTFGHPPLVMQMPYAEEIPQDNLLGGFTLMIEGDTSRIEEAFARHPEYWLHLGQADPSKTPNGLPRRPLGYIKLISARRGSSTSFLTVRSLACRFTSRWVIRLNSIACWEWKRISPGLRF